MRSEQARQTIAMGAVVVCLLLGALVFLNDDAYDPLDYPSSSFSIREVDAGDPVGPLPFLLVGETSICLDGVREWQ